MSGMTEQNRHNVKTILEDVPPGFYMDSKWFKAQGITRSSVSDYTANGWLEHVAHGVYRRPLPSSFEQSGFDDWQVLVLSLQKIMGYTVHVGGLTALKRQGHGHYVSLSQEKDVFLYAEKLPGWVANVPLNAPLTIRKPSLFTANAQGVQQHRTPQGDAPWWQWSLLSSSPERAILEALNELPDTVTFHTLDMAFQGLVNLSPRKLGPLLEACKKVQVKRLFYVFAERHNHAWFKHLDKYQVDLGTGDRSFVKGGKLHPKYRITVPPEYLPSSAEAQNEF